MMGVDRGEFQVTPSLNQIGCKSQSEMECAVYSLAGAILLMTQETLRNVSINSILMGWNVWKAAVKQADRGREL